MQPKKSNDPAMDLCIARVCVYFMSSSVNEMEMLVHYRGILFVPI